MKRLCGFSFDETNIGAVHTNQQCDNRHHARKQARAVQSADRHARNQLNVFTDFACSAADEVEVIRLLNQVADSVADVQIQRPQEVRKQVNCVLRRFPDTIQPVPRQPIPRRINIKVKLVVVDRIPAELVRRINGFVQQSGGVSLHREQIEK